MHKSRNLLFLESPVPCHACAGALHAGRLPLRGLERRARHIVLKLLLRVVLPAGRGVRRIALLYADARTIV